MAKHRKKEEYKSLFEYYGFTKKDEQECPVVSGILKELTPKRIKQEIEKIQAVKLPVELLKWVEEYEKVGDRDRFLWRWIRQGDEDVVKAFGISKNHFYLVQTVIFLIHMFTNLVDDVSERQEGENNLLKELLKIPLISHDANITVDTDQLCKKDQEYWKFTEKVWRGVNRNMKNLSYYKKVRSIFEYDIDQLLNTVKYSSLIYNHPYLVNKTEHSLYLSHSMQLIFVFDLYLMCFRFNSQRVAKSREVILCLQKMLRIGNDLATWEREVKKKDFANGISAYIVDSHHGMNVEVFKLGKGEIAQIARELGIERVLLREWEGNYQKVKEFGIENNLSINVEKLLCVVEKITFNHLAAKRNI